MTMRCKISSRGALCDFYMSGRRVGMQYAIPILSFPIFQFQQHIDIDTHDTDNERRQKDAMCLWCSTVYTA